VKERKSINVEVTLSLWIYTLWSWNEP